MPLGVPGDQEHGAPVHGVRSFTGSDPVFGYSRGQILFSVYMWDWCCSAVEMARPLRIQFAGAIYHVMARGNGRQLLFHEDRDYQRMTDGLEKTVGRTGWEVFAFVWLPNHIHSPFTMPGRVIRVVKTPCEPIGGLSKRDWPSLPPIRLLMPGTAGCWAVRDSSSGSKAGLAVLILLHLCARGAAWRRRIRRRSLQPLPNIMASWLKIIASVAQPRRDGTWRLIWRIGAPPPR